MEIEPRHVFYFIFLAVTLSLMTAIGDGVINTSGGVTYDLLHGDLSERVTAFGRLCVVDFDWLNLWMAWPLRIINLVFAILFVRFLWKLVPVIGR